MATWTGPIPAEWLKALTDEYAQPSAFFLSRRESGPMVVSRIRESVAKLRSVSEAGRRWIVAERCEYLGLSPTGACLPYIRVKRRAPPWPTPLDEDTTVRLMTIDMTY